MSRRSRRRAEERFADAPLDGPLLDVHDVQTFFKTPRGLVRAVDGVSLSLERGKTLGVVGESGSGKSVLSRSIMGLLPNNVVRHGSIKFEGREIGDAGTEAMRGYWGTMMSMVFQPPTLMAALSASAGVTLPKICGLSPRDAVAWPGSARNARPRSS